MINITLQEILEAVDGVLFNEALEEVEIQSISIDTRTIVKNSLFIGLKGDNFNGNLFWRDAINKGAKVLILEEEPIMDSDRIEASIIIVKNTRKALLDLASYYRNKLKIKVVGVTGSTGKTSTKDLIAAALSSKFKVYKTKGNYNNDIGLPLSILNIHDDVQVAVLEMGMNHAKEIHRLAEVARPDIGVITNIGITHIENLKTQDNIFNAKMEITDFFHEDNILIINGDDEYLRKIPNKDYKVIKTGILEDNEIKAKDVVSLDEGMKFILEVNNENKEILLPLLGVHSVYNSLLAIGVGISLGVDIDEIIKGFNNLETTAMRLEILKKGEITVINDCYNASPTSMKAAIDVLANMAGKKRIAVLGFMAELGDFTEDAHINIGRYAKEKGVDLLLTLDNVSEFYSKGFGESVLSFSDMKSLVGSLIDLTSPGDLVLIKASRSQRYEEITKGFLKN